MRKSKKKKTIVRTKHHRIGKLLGIMYERDGEKFLHRFKSAHPSIETDITGRKIFITGGKFKWTPFGVE